MPRSRQAPYRFLVDDWPEQSTNIGIGRSCRASSCESVGAPAYASSLCSSGARLSQLSTRASSSSNVKPRALNSKRQQFEPKPTTLMCALCCWR
jgi:hypothetical protein